MRVRGSRAFAVAVCAVLVFACGGGSGGGGLPADTGLTAGDFVRIAAGGIDDRLNSYPWATELFDGDGDGTPEIYVGTFGNAVCIQAGFGGSFARRWQCPTEVWNPDDLDPYLAACSTPAVVFRGTYDEVTDTWTWDRVFEPSLAEVLGFRSACVFDGALYMLGGVRSGSVWKTTDGTTWERALPRAMGFSGGFRGAQVFGGKLYIASDTTGTLFGSADPSADPGSWEPANSDGFVASGGGTHAVEESGTIDAATASSLTSAAVPWLPDGVVGTGFRVRITSGAGAGQDRAVVWNHGRTIYVECFGTGDVFDIVPAPGDTAEIYNPAFPDNGPSWQLAVFDGYLYAGTLNVIGGTELWKTDDPRPGNWRRVFAGGYGNPSKALVSTLQSYGGYLYVGTAYYPLFVEDAEEVHACEVLRVDASDNVEVLVGLNRASGTPGTNGGKPLSGLEDGFGQPSNLYVWYTAEGGDGWFYVGTLDVASQLRDIMDEDPDVVPLEYRLLVVLLLGPSGFDLWRTRDGIHWTEVDDGGLGNRDNYGIRNMIRTRWGLLLGVANHIDGFELWMGRR